MAVSLPMLLRIRNPSFVGLRPAVSFRVPSLKPLATNSPMASMSAWGMGSLRELSECLMNIRYFMVLSQGLIA
jgi:hypothetical protein